MSLVLFLWEVIIHTAKESIVEFCASKNHKEILAIWIFLRKKPQKDDWGIQNSIHELKAELLYLCVESKKFQELWNYCSISKV